MPSLPNFPVAKQEGENSCWACAGRMINNYYYAQGKAGNNPKFDTDTAIAEKVGLSIDKQESAAELLAQLNYANNTDGKPLAARSLIKKEIAKGKPLLAIIGKNNPGNKANLNVTQGHWLIITGIEDDTISVFDPDDGKIRTVAYSGKYGDYWWQNTSYVDPQ